MFIDLLILFAACLGVWTLTRIGDMLFQIGKVLVEIRDQTKPTTFSKGKPVK